MNTKTPVIAGVGQSTNRRKRICEPLDLMEEAARRAVADAGGWALDRIQSVVVVNILGWSYPDPASALADRIGAYSGQRLTTTVGGNTPQWLVARFCDAIAAGEIDGVLIAGAEALDSARRAREQGVQLERGDREAGPGASVIGDDRQATGPAEAAAGLFTPAVIYPMFESALAAEAGRGPAEQRRWLGELMAPFTEVAARHPGDAWFPEAATPEELSTVTDTNRYICEPYPKRMNAIMRVDQGAALLLLSAEAAESADVPRERWVFPWAGAECNDVFVTAERPDFTRSPAIRAAGRATFDAAGVGIDDVAMIDLYSCFPSAVQIGARELGIDLADPRGLTVTGGLPYFGGPGNNYVTHSIAVTVERLRREGGLGLVTANGWYVTKHAVGLYGSEPPPNGWRHADCSADQARIDAEALTVSSEAEGTATVEAMTVEHDRERGPVRAPAFARTPEGARVVVSAADPDLPAALSERSLVGEKIRVRPGEPGLVYEPL